MKRLIQIILIGLFLIASIPLTNANTRDDFLYETLKNIDPSTILESGITINKIDFKKLRGYRVGNSEWNNEQWACLLEFKNNTDHKLSGTIAIDVFDKEGFLLETFYIFAGEIKPNEGQKVSTHLFLNLRYINNIKSASLKASFIKK